MIKLSKNDIVLSEVAIIDDATFTSMSDYLDKFIEHIRAGNQISQSGIKVKVSNDVASKILGTTVITNGIISIIQCSADHDYMEVLTDSLLPPETIIW